MPSWKKLITSGSNAVLSNVTATTYISGSALVGKQTIASQTGANNVDLSTWEHIKDIIDEKRWGEPVVIKRDIIDEKQQIKYIELDSNLSIKINLEVIEDTFLLE